MRCARRVPVVIALAVLAVLVSAGPAAADPPRPGDVRSTITGVDPPTPTIHVSTDPSGALLRLRVDRGTEVLVLGYEDDQYLRFLPDGTVEENVLSPATYLNRTRLADTPLPTNASATAAPSWKRVAGGGSYAWHDHRTHYMAPGRPPAPAQWEVPLRVDGKVVNVTGRYEGVAPVASWPWWLAAMVAALALVALGWRRPRVVAAAVVASGGLVALAGAALLREPASGPPGWTAIGLGVVAVLAAVASAAVRDTARGPLLAGAGVALLLSSGRRLAVLQHPVLPTPLPAWLDRLSVALALGVGTAALVVGLRLVLRPSPTRSAPVAA